MRINMLASMLLLCGLAVAGVVAADSAPSAVASSVQLSSTDSLTHFTFGSCNKHDKPQPMWKHIMDRQAQLWIWLGDVVRGEKRDTADDDARSAADARSGQPSARPPAHMPIVLTSASPDSCAVSPCCLQIYADSATLEFFRRPSPLSTMERMYREQYLQADYTRLRQSATKIVGVYDDHDYGVNDGDASYSDKEPARHLFMDFVDEPRDSARRTRAQGGVYESYRWGTTATAAASANSTAASTTAAASSSTPSAAAASVPLADGRQTKLILLDSRFFQDSGRDDMLGEAQWAWLEAQVEDSGPTDLYVLGSGVQLVSRDKHIGEGWRLLPKSRARLLDIFANRRSNPGAMLLFLSGDVHFAESDVTYLAQDLADGRTKVTPFYEVTSSGLTHSVGSQVSPAVANILLPLILDERKSWEEDRQTEAASSAAAKAAAAATTEASSKPSASIRGFYSGLNFGDVQIDWAAERITVSIIGVDGLAHLGYTLPFSALRSSILPSSEVPAFVRGVAAAEAVRARSPPMWVIPGVKAGLLMVALVFAALAAAAMLLVRYCRAQAAAAASTKGSNSSNSNGKTKRAQAAPAASAPQSNTRKQR